MADKLEEQSLPNLTLKATIKGTVRIPEDFKNKWSLIYFYPKDDTPGCTKQSCGFRDHFEELQNKNTVLLGVSPDDVTFHQNFKSKFNLPFTLLVDSDHKIAEAYGTWGEKSMYGNKYMGIIRSHFIIDEKGKIQDAQYKVSPLDSIKKAVASVCE